MTLCLNEKAGPERWLDEWQVRGLESNSWNPLMAEGENQQLTYKVLQCKYEAGHGGACL